MAMTEPGISTPASPSDVGRHLRAVRKAKGLSRSEVARSAGLTRRELAAYERGKVPVPPSDLWCLAGSCGVDVEELVPPTSRVTIGSDLAALTVGDTVARLRPVPGNDGVLRDYVATLYELRNLPPGTRPPMRDEDLAKLARALGGTPEAIEARLHELIGASRAEAARLRGMILPPLPIAATDGAGTTAHGLTAMPAPPIAVPVGVGAGNGMGTAFPEASAPAPAAAYARPPETAPPYDGSWTAAPNAFPPPPAADQMIAPAIPLPAPDPAVTSAYPPPTFDFATPAPSIGDPEATDRFFSAPHAQDPFAPPPPLEAMAAPYEPLPPTLPDALADPVGSISGDSVLPAATGPFAPPAGPALDPFAADPFASGPSTTAVKSADPWPDQGPDAPTRPDGFVVDLGDEVRSRPFPAPVTDPFVTAGSAPADAEMVVLDVAPGPGAPDSGLPEVVFPASTGNGDGRLDDDPFAVLRVPVEGADLPFEDTSAGAPDTGFGGWSSDSEWAELGPEATETPAAFVTGAGGDAAGGDDELAGDWFDRAAAAADALIAEQRPDGPTASLAGEPDAAPVAPMAARASAFDTGIAAPAVADLPEVGGDAAGAAPPPIAWSLTAPATAPAAVPMDPPSSPGTFVAAGPDWQVGGIFPATAMADDGTLALRRADVRWALADVTAEGDFTVRAVVNFTSGAGFGILFRVSTDGSERITGYSFDVDPIYSGGGFLVRQWNDSRQHWKPLAHAPVADTARLYGAHVIEVSLRNDALVATIDGDTVLTVDQLSRRSIDAGHEPCRGGRVGVQAWSTTEVTVDRLLVAHH